VSFHGPCTIYLSGVWLHSRCCCSSHLLAGDALLLSLGCRFELCSEDFEFRVTISYYQVT
jgi:hypothetical protein